MTAKEEILMKTIELFNLHGYEKITMRDIAKAMNKSVGNITYHYPKKVDLMSAIGQMIFGEFRSLQLETNLDIHEFQKQLEYMAAFQKQYAFYFSNIISLIKEQSEIAEGEKRQLEVREKLISYFNKVFENFESSKIFIPFPAKESSRYLAEGIVIIILSWKYAEKSKEDKSYKELIKIIWNILYSNLTEEGVRQFEQEKI